MMNRDEIQAAIQHNMRVAKLELADVRVQPDAYSGWRIVVVSSGFDGKSALDRKSIALKGLETLHIEEFDLLTPQEQEWAGSLPQDSDLEDLPLWAESLARKPSDKTVVFPSDLDDDLDPPIVTTFYSLRGGVGRSTALAYVGRILAAHGRKVVCVDMDLEAPGLAALFGVEDNVEANTGVVRLLLDLDQAEKPDITRHLIHLEGSDDLYILPAGRPDAEYARRLRYIDPLAWYREERNPLRLLIEGLQKSLPFTPDVILLDARTGISPISGPLLFDLADVAIIMFYPHPQAREGTAALVSGLLAARTCRSRGEKVLTPEPRFVVSPIPASKAREVVARYQHRALEWIAEWLNPVNQLRAGAEPLIESDITRFVQYREDVATSDLILKDSEIWRTFDPIAEWIERFLPSMEEKGELVSLATEKNTILQELKFAPGTAENQDDLLGTFVETELVKKASDPAVPLVLGRKGAGKTALFRRFAEDTKFNSIVVNAPGPLRGQRRWLLSIDGFRSVDDVLKRAQAEWRQFWAYYICVTTSNQLARDHVNVLPAPLATAVGSLPASEADVVETFERILGLQRHGLLMNEWLARIDFAAKTDTLLLFDGLDTGFGNSDIERGRRTSAVEGLFALWTDQGSSLQNLRFKIVLREDIWKQLRFENKSHLYGRSVALKWSDPISYYKVVLKQAIRSRAFEAQLHTMGGRADAAASDPSRWGEDEVLSAWNLLVGERMKGGKTAFTRNWVWNRLADANNDHTPRYLLQLFREVVSWEKDEHGRSPYERSVIRPRALVQRLPAVSQQALDALREEYQELDSLFARLKEIGRTPVRADELTSINELALATEVGLLTIYEGSEERVQRYKVPDIYRHGLGMTRKGQA